MKKLLATLLVAVMIMSCMSVVSFAASTTLKVPASYPYEGMLDHQMALPDYGMIAGANKAFEYMFTTYRTQPGIAKYFVDNALTKDPSGYVATVGDYVYVPVIIESIDTGITYFNAEISFDGNLFEYVEMKGVDGWTPSGSATGNVISIGAVGTASAAVSAADTYIGYVILKVKAATDTDANPSDCKTTTNFTLTKSNVVYTGDSDETPATISTSTMTMDVAGLTAGEAGSDEPTDITEDEVKAITPVVVGTFEATNMVADIKTAYGVDVTLADEFDAENMSYIPVFASVPTENKNAPAAYGIIISGEGVEELKIPVTNAVDGKFGVVLYGFTGHIEKYTEVSVYVTVGESTYTSALGDL